MNSINSETFILPKVPFSVPKLQKVYETCNENVDKTKLLNSFKLLTSYVSSYYYELEKSNYLFYDVNNDIFKMKEKKIL